MLIVDDLLMLPAKGFMGIFRNIARQVEEEMTDEGKVKEELMEIQMLFETDQITETEYDQREQGLLTRLEDIQRYKKQT
jgi:hypothetical protein